MAGNVCVGEDVCDVLRNGLVWSDSGCSITAALDRSLYTKVNKVLENFGGKWNRSKKEHVFENLGDAMVGVRETAESGEFIDMRKARQFFPTPSVVVQQLIEILTETDEGFELDGSLVLEPSAGRGAIALKLKDCGADVVCIEIHEPDAKLLKEKGLHVMTADFLDVTPSEYDAVVMNPPFTRGQDMRHVMYAYEFVKPGGCLVAIVCEGYSFRNDSLAVTFRSWLSSIDGTLKISGRRVNVTQIPAGAFAESGTNVRTRILRIPKV